MQSSLLVVEFAEEGSIETSGEEPSSSCWRAAQPVHRFLALFGTRGCLQNRGVSESPVGICSSLGNAASGR